MPEDEAQQRRPSGEALEDPDELLYRQVHPQFVDEGRVGSQAFRPTKKDEGLLSTSRSSVTDARSAYEHYTGQLVLRSAGTWGVSVGEVKGAELTAYEDPIIEEPADASHASIDFQGFGESQAKAKSGELARRARERGVLYEPE